jgi:hypothetical protein
LPITSLTTSISLGCVCPHRRVLHSHHAVSVPTIVDLHVRSLTSIIQVSQWRNLKESVDILDLYVLANVSLKYLPLLVDKVERICEENGLRNDSIVMRMTGCPNGCARPYVAGGSHTSPQLS